QKKNDVKARSMLLMALPNEHLMTFNQYKDAKTLFVAIQTRFGGNEAIKKTQETLLKQMYEKFSAPSTESLDSFFNRNKPDLDTMSFDDLYNNFKIVKQEVKGTASSSSSLSSQNMDFVSSPSSTNEVNTDYGVSTANTQIIPTSTQVSTAIIEHEDKKVFLENWMGHFVRECRGPRNQNCRNRNQDSSRRTINVEETSSKAMVAIDGAGFYWSYMTDDEVHTNMALMAFLDSEVNNDKTCSKTCLKSFETLKTQLDDLRIEFNKSKFNLATYKRGLASVEEQLVFYQKNEVIFYKQLVVLKRDISYKDSEIGMLKSELEKLKQEKESCQLKIENFNNASKSLDKLIGSQIPDKSRKGVGFVSYNAVPPPHTGLFSPPKLDLSNSGLEEFQEPEFEGYGPKTSKSVSKDISNKVRESLDAPLVEELVSDDKPKAVNTARPNSVVVNAVRANQVNAVKASTCWGWRTYHLNCASFTLNDIIMLTDGADSRTVPILSDSRNLNEDIYLLEGGAKMRENYERNNMYSVDMKNIIPKESLTCLVAKATLDESMLWHRRLDVNTTGPSINTEPDMFSLRDNATLEATHADFFGDEIEVDMSNITTTYLVPSTPNTRIHKDHSLDHVIGDVQSGVQTKRMTKTINEQGFISAVYEGKTHEDLYTCLFACFNIPGRHPHGIAKALSDLAWVEAMQEELLQFKLQKVWVLVDLPKGFMVVSDGYEECFPLWSDRKGGLQVKQKEDGIFISQDKYVTDILRKFRFTDVRTASTLMDTKNPLLKESDGDDVDVHLYMSMIRSLMYLTLFRPDIMFAVCACARFQVTSKVLYLKQFWQTATAKTLDNGEIEITATIDGTIKIVTKASARRHLQLADADGISSLPTTEIFEQLSLMGQESVVSQPKSPTQTLVADGTIYKEKGDSVERAATTATSLEAEQDSGNINRTQSTTIPNDPFPQGIGLGGSPRRQDTILGDRLLQTMVCEKIYGAAYTRLIKKVEIEKLEGNQDSREPYENDIGLTLILMLLRKFLLLRKMLVLLSIYNAGEAVSTCCVVTDVASKRKKVNGSFNVEEWEDIQARVQADEELAQRLQAEEREKYTEAEQARMLAELIIQRKRYFAGQIAEERRNKPPTQA
ncbi:hypothetical protein Tco_1002602, partial [Tanacetum coccineum]